MCTLFIMWVMNSDDVVWVPKHIPTNPSTDLRMYILSLSYMDQISWAAKRLKSLQCWASMWKVVFNSVCVVEPFVMNGTHLGLPMDGNEDMSSILKFRDIFDINTWNSEGQLGSIDYPDVIGWGDFLKDAPRSVVTVQIVYADDYRCKENHLTEKMCGSRRLNQAMSLVLRPHNFTLMNQVCIDFTSLGSLSMQEFNDYIYDAIPEETPVTIIFDEWRGPVDKHVKNKCFVLIEGGVCTPNVRGPLFDLATHLLVPSSKIEDGTNRYISQYLNDPSGFITVMIRWEKIVLTDFFNPTSSHFSGAGCVKMITDYLNSIYKEKGVSSVFLTVDVGKYGSTSLNLYETVEKSRVRFISYTETLLRAISNDDSMSLADHDRKFEEVSGSTDRAFISQLQKSIAANARCLLLVGSGMFHEHALKLYQKLQPGKPDCHKIIRTC